MERDERVEAWYLDSQMVLDSVNHELIGRKVKVFSADADVKNWTAESEE